MIMAPVAERAASGVVPKPTAPPRVTVPPVPLFKVNVLAVVRLRIVLVEPEKVILAPAGAALVVFMTRFDTPIVTGPVKVTAPPAVVISPSRVIPPVIV